MNAYSPHTQPILQIVGYKNSGKTTLMIELIRRLKQADFTVGTVKHDAHDYHMDHPGTDSWKHQEAGADVTAITSPHQSTILRQYHQPLHDLIKQMDTVDILLVEGFKQESYPKLVLMRSAEDFALLESVNNPIAVILWPEASASWPNTSEASHNKRLPCFAIDSTTEIYSFLFTTYFRC